MNMSTNHSTKKSRCSHFSAPERGEISAYLKMGKKTAEIARLLGPHRSTISRAAASFKFKIRMENSYTQMSTFQTVVNVSMRPIDKIVLIAN